MTNTSPLGTEVPTAEKEQEQQSLLWLSSLLDILLRDCPWDRAQTTESLRYLTLEETYELSDAILRHDSEDTRKELGDLFMHILFYSKLAAAQGQFSLTDVVDGVCRKLIGRHPHLSLPDREGVLQPAAGTQATAWEQVKMREGRRSVLEGVPQALPSLLKSVRMQEKAAGAGFDYPSMQGVQDKVQEEYAEWQEAVAEGDAEHMEEEFGDLLFALVKWGSALGVNADTALERANRKFQRRFVAMEQQLAARGTTFAALSPQELLALWQQAKADTEG